ncbi:MAG: hypothetical protein U0353_29165 [Sandaracinus sp.]
MPSGACSLVSRRAAERASASVPPGRRTKSKKPQPWAHGSDEQVRAYEKAYAEVMVAYELASTRYPETGVLCPFLAGTFPPRIPVPREVL